MAAMSVTEQLLVQAKRELALAEGQLAADPHNPWHRKSVIHAQGRVESILQLLKEDHKDQTG
jgi:hypothetical protein